MIPAAAASSDPLSRIVSGPLPSVPLTTCEIAGKFVNENAAALALNVTTLCAACAVTSATLADKGKRRTALACPFASVNVETETSFAPGDAVNVTGCPGAGFPRLSFNTTVSGVARTAPGAPVWPSPLRTARVVATEDAARIVYEACAARLPETCAARTTMVPLDAPGGT